MVLEILYATHQKTLVSQRAAKVLSYIGDDPLSVRDTVRYSYVIRNKFVHGAILTKEINEKARKLRPKIFDVARKSIIAQLHIQDKKDQFLEKIDDAILDSKADTELEEILSRNPALMVLKK